MGQRHSYSDLGTITCALADKSRRGSRLAIDRVAVAVLILTAASSASFAEDGIDLPPVPPELLKHADVTLEGPFRASPDRIVYRRPTWDIFPQNSNDTVLPGGVLTKLKEHVEVTGLRLFHGPKTSDISSDAFVVEFTPEAIADVGTLTHLEYLTIWNVDLTRRDGLKFLKSLDGLREIDFWNCNVELQDVLAHLPPSRHLRAISLRYLPKPRTVKPSTVRRVVAKTQIQKLVTNSPRLQSIAVTSTEQFEPDAITQFAQLQGLNKLHISYPSYHVYLGHGRIVRAERPAFDSQQQAVGKSLERLFAAKGIRKWPGSAPRLKRTYRLRYEMILVPNASPVSAPVPAPVPVKSP